MKSDDNSHDGAIATVAGEISRPAPAVERTQKGRSSKSKATKKAKGKAAKKSCAVEARFAPFAGGVEWTDPVAPTVVAAPVNGGGLHGRERLEEERVAEGDEEHEHPATVENGPAPATEDPVPAGQVPGRGAGASDDSDGPESAPSSIRRWTRSKTAAVGVCVLVAALTAALILSLLALSNQDSQASQRTSALAAARTYAVQLASYNYTHLDSGFAALAAESTPSFRRSFTESSNALKSTLTRYKATAEASVVSAGLVSSGSSQAVALVFLTQKIANSTQAKPTTDRSQVQITLVSSGGRWLINLVTLL